MSVQVTASRPSGKSVGAAAGGAVLTLAVFVAVFVGFLIAPIAALVIAFLVWNVMRPRQQQRSASGGETGTNQPSSGFGAGTR